MPQKSYISLVWALPKPFELILTNTVYLKIVFKLKLWIVKCCECFACHSPTYGQQSPHYRKVENETLESGFDLALVGDPLYDPEQKLVWRTDPAWKIEKPKSGWPLVPFLREERIRYFTWKIGYMKTSTWKIGTLLKQTWKIGKLLSWT